MQWNKIWSNLRLDMMEYPARWNLIHRLLPRIKLGSHTANIIKSTQIEWINVTKLHRSWVKIKSDACFLKIKTTSKQAKSAKYSKSQVNYVADLTIRMKARRDRILSLKVAALLDGTPYKIWRSTSK